MAVVPSPSSVFDAGTRAANFFTKTSGADYLIVVRNLQRRCVFARCADY